jgi:hypothetical protein
MRSVRVLTALLLLQAAATQAARLDEAAVSIAIVESGRYAVQSAHQREPARDTTAGFSSVVDAELVAEGQKIPLRLGEAFGFRFAISDAAQHAEWVPVTIRISHPELPDHRGRPSRGFEMQSAARLATDGQYHNAAWYLLSRPHELAAGEWEIAVLYRGRQLAARTFFLYDQVGDQPDDTRRQAGDAAGNTARFASAE